MITLADSYAWCRGVARRRAKNFYYSFVLLTAERKNAMCAVYAFMRYCDDLSDEPGASRSAMDRWRAALTNALEGKYDGHPAWPAFHDTVKRFQIPHEYFYQMIEGVSSDLEPRRIQTFDELYRYCYQVASVVGLTTIHIFGFESPEALALAEKCGVAFQLTNILRDVREDEERGRIYIPAEDLEKYRVSEFKMSDEFRALMAFEADRARSYYEASRPLLSLVDKGSRQSLWALIEIYSRLLDRIRDSNYDVLRLRIRLSSLEKSAIVAQAFLPVRHF